MAGIAALIVSANPDLTALEIVSILKRTASKDLDFQAYPRTPSAAFDPDTSWDISPIPPLDNGDFSDVGDEDGTWSPWFGHGRVDAAAAVAEAMRRGVRPGDLTFQSDSSPDKSIPDNNSRGIKDKIVCDQAFTLRSLKVHVDITHTYIGDLRVELVSPSDTHVLLHNRTGGSANNIIKTYTGENTPHLQILRGETINGLWRLNVSDHAGADQGKLNRWALKLMPSA